MVNVITHSVYDVGTRHEIVAENAANPVWVKIKTLAGADLPDQGSSQEYVFVVWCDVGDQSVQPNVDGAIVRVSLGNQNGVFDGYARHGLRWAPYSRVTHRYHGQPYFFVRGYTSGGRGTWNTANDLCLYAQINPNGDPPSEVAGSKAVVTNIGMVAYSLADVSTSEYLWHRRVFSPPVFNEGFVTAFTQHDLSVTAPWNPGTESQYLVATSIRYAPRAPVLQATTPVLNVVYTSDGTWTPGGGLENVTARGNSAGLAVRTASSTPNTTTAYFRHSHGGYYVKVTPDTAGEFGLQGTDLGIPPASNQRTQIDEWEIFALRADSSASYGGLGNFVYTQKDQGTLPEIFDDGTVYEPGEFLNQPTAPVTDVYMQAHNRLPTQDIGFSPIIGTNREPSVSPDFFCDYRNGRGEGVTQHLGTSADPLQRGGAGTVQARFAFYQDTGQAAAVRKRGDDFVAFAWNRDNEADAVPIAVPLTPSAVALVPDRESPAVGTLNPLPNDAAGEQMLPTVTRQETPDEPRHDLLSDDLTRITWPRFLVTRREWQVSWPGLTRADRDTLLTFLNTQSNRVFRWTPPRTDGRGEAEVAVLCLDGPTSTDRELLHDVSARLAELIFTS